MKCPVCYIARFLGLALLISCSLILVLMDNTKAFVKGLGSDLCLLGQEIANSAKLAAKGESFL